jgi:hypothetical protein
MTVFYTTTFLVGIRPARWYGTRLLPLATALLVVVIEAAEFSESLWRFVVIIVANVVVIVGIFCVVDVRDF